MEGFGLGVREVILQKAWKKDPGFRKVLKAALLVKTGIFATIILGCFLLPFVAANYEGNFHYPPRAEPGFSAHFKTWDAQHYLFLSEQGYQAGQPGNAFYPLFPFLIRIFHYLFLGSSLAAGLILSNFFSLTALAFLYLWASPKFGKEKAALGCYLLLAFPTAFYMDLVYTESLFLALSIALFYFLEERKTSGAAFCAFLLPLVRPTGLLVLAPALAALFWERSRPSQRRGQAQWAVPLAFGAGFGLYLGLMQFWTGDCWAGFHAQRFFTSGYGVTNLLHPLHWAMANFVTGPFTWMGFGTGLLDRLFFLLFLGTAAFGYRSLDPPSRVYCLVLGLVPALSGDLASFDRYWISLFPLFPVLAVRLGRKAAYLLGIFLPLQGVLVLAHSLNIWVG